MVVSFSNNSELFYLKCIYSWFYGLHMNVMVSSIYMSMVCYSKAYLTPLLSLEQALVSLWSDYHSAPRGFVIYVGIVPFNASI